MTRRPLLWIVAALAAAAVGVGAPATPASGQAAFWTLTIDDHPEVVDARPLEVRGDVRFLGPLGVIAPVQDVTVALLPQGLPEACAVEPKRVVPSGDRYAVEMEPRCNGPHRISVTARSRSGSRSGAPKTEDLGLAWAGPAPAAPDAVGTGTGALVSWPGTAEPDVVGWTLVDVGTYPREQTSVAVAAGPGPRTFRLAAVRWGAEGPDGPRVTSPPSAERSVTVPTPQSPPSPPDAPAAASPPPAPSRAGAGAAPPAPGTTGPPTTSRRTGPPTRGSGSAATLPEGYSEELPYGVPDDAFEPGAEPAAEPDGDAEETAAGTSPSASLVRTSEKRAPGLVAPFALGLLLVTVATHIGWYLRRSRPGPDEQVSLL